MASIGYVCPLVAVGNVSTGCESLVFTVGIGSTGCVSLVFAVGIGSTGYGGLPDGDDR